MHKILALPAHLHMLTRVPSESTGPEATASPKPTVGSEPVREGKDGKKGKKEGRREGRKEERKEGKKDVSSLLFAGILEMVTKQDLIEQSGFFRIDGKYYSKSLGILWLEVRLNNFFIQDK